MAIATIRMYPGRTEEQKRALVTAVADALETHAGATRERIYVVIEEIAPDNWGVAGTYGLDDKLTKSLGY